MKKKTALLITVLIICMVLVGCGASSDSEAGAPAVGGLDSTTEAPAAAGGPETYSTIDDEDMTEQSIVEPSLDEVIDDVLSYVKSEGMIIVDEDSINDIIEVMYIAEGSDALNIFNILCADGKIVPAPIEPKGIIVLKYSKGASRKWNNTGTYAMTTFTVRLDCIDPDTGNVSNLRIFSSENTYSCSFVTNGLGDNTTLSLMHFNSDLTQMTATLTLEDGSVHVGWIDERGDFTDVSAKVTNNSDFGALVNHSNPCFGPGGYFYFRDSTNSNIQDKRVPLSDLSVSAVETLLENVGYAGRPLYPHPDGTVMDRKWQNNYYYDENMTYPAQEGLFDDWISPSEYVGIYDNVIYKYVLNGPNDAPRWYKDGIALVPAVKGRTNRYAVVSPDGTKVAFLSTLTTGTDTSPYLYIVPVDGGDPVKVSTDYIFENGLVYTDNYAFDANVLLAWE